MAVLCATLDFEQSNVNLNPGLSNPTPTVYAMMLLHTIHWGIKLYVLFKRIKFHLAQKNQTASADIPNTNISNTILKHNKDNSAFA